MHISHKEMFDHIYCISFSLESWYLFCFLSKPHLPQNISLTKIIVKYEEGYGSQFYSNLKKIYKNIFHHATKNKFTNIFVIFDNIVYCHNNINNIFLNSKELSRKIISLIQLPSNKSFIHWKATIIPNEMFPFVFDNENL